LAWRPRLDRTRPERLSMGGMSLSPIRPLLVAGAALLLSACGPVIIQTQLTSSTEIEGAQDPLLGQLLGQFPGFEQFSNIDFDANQDLKKQGISKDQVDSVKITSVTLTISAPDDV